MVSRDTCIELLEQFILEEDRIVTCKILSQELDIHLNIAKQYLTDFFKIQKSKNVLLQVTYFLAGVLEEDGRKVMKVVVASEDNVEELKRLLNVTSCHIYSLSKSKVDKVSLLASEKQCNENGGLNKYFGIKHPTIETKPSVLKKIVIKNDSKSSTPNQVSIKNGSSDKKDSVEAKNLKPSVEEKTEPEKKTLEKTKAPSKDQKSNPLASMWQKKEEKPKESKNENSKPEAKGKNKSPGNSKNAAVAKNSIMSMFSKQAAKKSENPKKETSKPPETVKETKIETPEVKINEEPKVVEKNKESKKPLPTKTSIKRKSNSQSKKSKGKSNNESDEEAPLPKKKKHRRICTFDDSDSESENEEAQDKAQRNLLQSENPMELDEKISPMHLTDDEEPIPPTPQGNTKGRKRIWKTVQKTFKDEDGFFVTKQQKELVSASESDDESPIPNNNKEITKPNFSYRKQSSLTSFFKQS